MSAAVACHVTDKRASHWDRPCLVDFIVTASNAIMIKIVHNRGPFFFLRFEIMLRFVKLSCGCIMGERPAKTQACKQSAQFTIRFIVSAEASHVCS